MAKRNMINREAKRIALTAKYAKKPFRAAVARIRVAPVSRPVAFAWGPPIPLRVFASLRLCEMFVFQQLSGKAIEK